MGTLAAFTRLRKSLGQNFPLPSDVTFVTGAALLKELGIVSHITPDMIRYKARTDTEKWRFGDKPGQIPYGKHGNARTMATPHFLEYFLTDYEDTGRGPDQKPRKRSEEAS
jgi:hypothetical protein